MWPLISSSSTCSACAAASSGVSANWTPPAFIRPPVSTWDLITTGPPISLGDPPRLLGGLGEPVLGDGDPGLGDDRPRLVLEETHRRRGSLASRTLFGVLARTILVR